MKNALCPACGAEIRFHSSISVYAVCAYCRSMVVRHDMDLETIGTMAELPDDMSPLQVGTEGQYNGVAFALLGRAKMAWDAGSWNEWFLWTYDGRKGWLAEAQGFYAASFEIDPPWEKDNQRSMASVRAALGEGVEPAPSTGDEKPAPKGQLGDYLKFNGSFYRVVDIKKATCVGSEGELPLAAPKGRSILSIDLLGQQGEFGSIELDGQQGRLFLGHYRPWDTFKFRNLRQLEGWS